MSNYATKLGDTELDQGEEVETSGHSDNTEHVE